MEFISKILPYAQIVLSLILIAGVLLQQSAAGIGGAFGDNWSSAFHSRRGAERFFFFTTVVASILFFISACLALIS